MAFKKTAYACLALCLMAILVIAMSGCEDLGEYDDTEEYYECFDDIVLIDGTTGDDESYSVEDYFYNEESRENYLVGEDGVYHGIAHGEYVYMAIPFECNMTMDTLALYVQSMTDVTVYINVYVADRIPSAWKPLDDVEQQPSGSDDSSEGSSEDSTENDEPVYDDPDPQTRIGDLTLHLKKGKWSSFVLDSFQVSGAVQKSIQIKDGQYILLHIRNNSVVRWFDEDKQVYVDPQTGLQIPRAKITMTNLLIRALEIEDETDAQGG